MNLSTFIRYWVLPGTYCLSNDMLRVGNQLAGLNLIALDATLVFWIVVLCPMGTE